MLRYTAQQLFSIAAMMKQTGAVGRLPTTVWSTLKSHGLCNKYIKRGTRAGINRQRPIRVVVNCRNILPRKQQPGVCVSNLVGIKTDTFNIPTLMNTNARSLIPKLDELSVTLTEHKVDVCCITESWCPTSVPDRVLLLDHYHPPIRHNRDHTSGGGIVCYVHAAIPFSVFRNLAIENVESVWLKLQPQRLPRQFNPIVLGSYLSAP